MAVTLADIKKLRDITGAGMMDVKKALEEANGDFEQAKDLLRKRGQAIAAKRSDREASEGCVLAQAVDGFGAIDWEITAQIGDGFEMGGLESLIKVSEDAIPGDMCAVKAYSVGNPEVYSIVIVKVK